MKHIFFLLAVMSIALHTWAQNADTMQQGGQNTASLLLDSGKGLTLGGYGEVHYNQPLGNETYSPETLDVHRMVLFVGYNFDERTQFVTEIEAEYAKELWIEQAFLQHRIAPWLNLRAGLLLVPMGIINEYHEPVTFNGVERPVIDNMIVPATWREVGLGACGTIQAVSVRYQVYAMSGLNGYDGSQGLFNGAKGLREGRQKGSKAYSLSPAISGKLEFYGLKGLTFGASAYAGKSQSRIFSTLHKDSLTAVERADSSVVGIAMLGFDARYRFRGFEYRGQVYYTSMSNSLQYNEFTGKQGVSNDLGSAMWGYYVEAGYDVFRLSRTKSAELVPFVRYQKYNTHHRVPANVAANEAFRAVVLTTGMSLRFAKGAILKADVDFVKPASNDTYQKTFNAGIGVMF